jgi:hypothetical protein
MDKRLLSFCSWFLLYPAKRPVMVVNEGIGFSGDYGWARLNLESAAPSASKYSGGNGAPALLDEREI